MLSTSLSGNISDHIVRYCICRTVAERNNYQYGINKVTSHDYFGGIEQMTFFKDINYGLENHTPYGELPEGTKYVWEEKREMHDGYNYHPFQPDIFDVPEDTKLVIYCGQDAKYLQKEKCAKWLEVKDDIVELSKLLLNNAGIELDDDLCLLSARGGEYRSVPSLFLTYNYWDKAMKLMLDKNPKMKFLVLTEDPEFYRNFFNVPVMHFSCQTDWWAINNCKNAIVANSGFNIFPIWLNKNNPFAIAPYLWANHNFGDNEEWANSDMRSWGCFNFMDREGNIIE